ncbi:MAG: outer-membrane lipoprotein carrier protein LolA [Clostridium sp.]|nr:outer-membrane lipoprotein carrier protein LolA [Prevotella sp.]MCM1428746.1 outer-membrane lipoprotein carrier protein LolA [Clostridium sp.]MCM1475121.1 outer-membrane lipoprotein carrier protein LolA [Muribaculaceae bacterium]
MVSIRQVLGKAFTVRLAIVTTFCMFVAIAMCPMNAAATETASQLLSRASSKISSSGGLQASFSLSGGVSTSGTIYSSGKKFAIISGASSSWYNGSSLWTYNPAVKETTLVTPTSAELQESNPLLYVGGASKFNAAFVKGSPAGTKMIQLLPKSKKTGVKRIIVTLNAKTLIPSKIVVYPSTGGAVTLSISNVKLGVKFAASTFVYPAKKYPGVTVVDLR